MCDGRPPTPDELPACYSSEDWTGVSLEEFMACPSNLANNRQTRMLADLSLVGCYNLSSMSEERRAELLLSSAKRNLLRMAFFGLTEFQRKTQFLFERMFGLHFITAFTQINGTRAAGVTVGTPTRRRIEELNALDMQLYEYARELFSQRVQYYHHQERQEERERKRQQRRRMKEQKASQIQPQEDNERKDAEQENTVVTEDYSSQVVRWWCCALWLCSYDYRAILTVLEVYSMHTVQSMQCAYIHSKTGFPKGGFPVNHFGFLKWSVLKRTISFLVWRTFE